MQPLPLGWRVTQCVQAGHRLLLLGPVHLEAIKGVALPVLVQLSDNHGLHSPKKGCEPGAVVLGRRQHAGRHRGLGLHLSISMLLGLGARFGSGDAGRLATFLEKEIQSWQSPASLQPASPAQDTQPPSVEQLTFPVAAYPQAPGPLLTLSAQSLSLPSGNYTICVVWVERTPQPCYAPLREDT